MATFSHFIHGISSSNGNVLMAALISLLLVVLFVLLLHIYAKWFLAQSRIRQRRWRTVVRPDRFIHFQSFPFESSVFGSKGLDSSAISSIPLFLYSSKEQSLECVICLSQFEENEVGRNLSKCGHRFHVECVDIWLQSHSNCPICRAPAVSLLPETNYNNQVDAGGNGEVGVAVVTVIDRDPTELEVEIHPSSDFDNNNHNVELKKDGNSMSASSSSTSIGCSLKRMLSRNKAEGKIFPSFE